MSTPESVFDKVADILVEATKSGKNLAYVKNVFKGWRDNINDSHIPCIIIEPESVKETVPFYEEESELYFGLLITGIIKIWDKNKQIVGDARQKGILDIDNDIKKTLGADVNLGGTAMMFTFPDTRYDYTAFPLRGVQITIDIRFRTKYKERT